MPVWSGMSKVQLENELEGDFMTESHAVENILSLYLLNVTFLYLRTLAVDLNQIGRMYRDLNREVKKSD
jgi:hypothetical protein